ncbi:MAG: LuxR C-terminal-related transcriptional regulator [Slackia sp.]|nr:LuxR C-terminal-related transcriptional regulator [Slackia sp.]
MQASTTRLETLKSYIPLAPIVMGLALSHTAMMVAGFSGLTNGFEALRSGLGTCIAAIPMLIAMGMLYKARGPLSEKAVDAAFFVSIIVQSASIMALGSVAIDGSAPAGVSIALSAVASLSSWISILTWLRHMKAASSIAAVIVAFGALSVAQPVVYALVLVPPADACLVAGMLGILQAPLAFFIHKRDPFERLAEAPNTGYFGFESTKTDTPRLFLTMTASVLALSLAMGVIEGSPFRFVQGGAPLPDAGYVAVTTAVTVGIVVGAALRPRTMMTTGIWILMQGLGITALLFYVAFPERLSIGAALSTTLSAVMTGLVWYLITAFSHYGAKDPLFYGLAGWLAYLVPRALVQIAVGQFAQPLWGDPMLLTALTGALILASTQFVFIRLLKTAYSDNDAAQESTQRLEKLLGLKDTQAGSESMRKELVRHDVAKLQEAFGLSDREAEVVALYALGKTQQAIAEELCITPSTVRVHIKHVYAKTGLHSRQELIDRMGKA